MGGAAVLLLLVALVALFRGDQHEQPPGQSVAVGHIHGIGVNPADGRVHIGAHLGVFEIGRDGDVSPVGGERFDTMGFAVAGPDQFLASGHPDSTSDRPLHLGLIQSDDAGQTWNDISLGGEADFHALEEIDGRVWGIDSIGGRLLTSTDGGQWDLAAKGQFIDLAIDPDDPTHTMVTDQTGQLLAVTTTSSAPRSVPAPALAYLDWPTRNELVGLAPDGTVNVSSDQGLTWQIAGTVPGRPTALEASDQGWYAATDTGLYSSTDAGATWTALFEFSGTP